MKIREVIETSGWIDGQGYSYEHVVFSDKFEEISSIDKIPHPREWWPEFFNYDECEEQGGEDILVKIKYYLEDDEDMEKPVKEFSFWNNKMFKDFMEEN